MKRIISALVVIGALAFSFNIPVQAEEATVGEEQTTEQTVEEETDTTEVAIPMEMYDEKAAVVPYHLVYISDSGQEEVLKAGYGFFIGDKNQKVYMICCYDTVVLSEEEKQALATKYEIEYNQINTKIKIFLKSDITVEATVFSSSEEMDFAIVEPASDLSGCTTLRLCEDANVNANGTSIYSFTLPILATNSDATTSNIQRIDGEIQDWSDINEVHYYKYIMSDTPVPGMPVINDRGEVIALSTNISAAPNGEYYASIQISEIIEVLNTFGIVYNPEIVIDLAPVDEIILEFEELDPEKYTKETWEIAEASYDALLEVKKKVEDGDLDYYTQGEVDEAINNLRIAIDELSEPEVNIKKYTIIAIIVGSVLFVVVLILLIVMLVNKSKYKKKIQEEKDNKQSAMDILKMSGRITPGTIHNQVNNLPMNRSLDGIDYTDSCATSETTVLSQSGVMLEQDMQSGQLYQETMISFPRLIRRKTGESVIINKNSFIIGKSPELVDYCVRYNSNISRKHVCIIRMADGYYIQDLDTTNGTYVNGIRVTSARSVKLEEGYLIQMAEEEFEFTY